VAGTPGNYEVWTGLDLPFELFRSGPPLLVSVARHLGIFEVWFVVLLAVGLVEMTRVKVRSAALTAGVTYAMVLIAVVTMDLLVR
jgi:cyanate permease